MQNWYVYIVRCADGSFYTGVTTDPVRREHEHNTSDRLGARYTRARRPVRLVWLEPQADRSAALKREYAIKQLRRTAKCRLIETFAASRDTRESALLTTLSPSLAKTEKAP